MGTTDVSGLKPCPFCGNPPDAFPSGDGTGTMIECMTVGCVGPHVSYYGEGEAAKRWNKRAEAASALTALRDERDRLRAALGVPKVWTVTEVDGMMNAFYAAQEKHGRTESLFAAAAWLLRHRQARALLSTPADRTEGET